MENFGYHHIYPGPNHLIVRGIYCTCIWMDGDIRLDKTAGTSVDAKHSKFPTTVAHCSLIVACVALTP